MASNPVFTEITEWETIPQGFSKFSPHRKDCLNPHAKNYNALYFRHGDTTVFIRCDKDWNITEMSMVKPGNVHMTSVDTPEDQLKRETIKVANEQFNKKKMLNGI